MDRFTQYVPAMLSTNTLEFRRSACHLLDLVFTNIPDLLSPLVDVMAPIGRSDNLPVVVQSARHFSSNIPDAISSHPDPVIARTKWLFHQQDGEKKLDAFLLENWTLKIGHTCLRRRKISTKSGNVGRHSSFETSNHSLGTKLRTSNLDLQR